MVSDGLIFDIKRDCSEDGPGIRTTVFFKGCPLSCAWCQNPEGKEKYPELFFDAPLCHPRQCGMPCVDACPEKCIELVNGEITLHRDGCSGCNRCGKACPTGALEAAGFRIGLDDLLYRIMIDKPLFDSSGGGVTLSGGEVTRQMDFARRLLRAIKAEGVHTAIETSGFFSYRRFSESMLPWLDLVYFDLKLIDDAVSRKFTGQGNSLILENFARLVKSSRIPVIPRVPLIPGITTGRKNLRGIADFLQSQGVDAATLLPYNPLWSDKSLRLAKNPGYRRADFMTPREKQECIVSFRPSDSTELR